MTKFRRPAVARRIRSLAVMEAVNIPLQAWIWFGVASLPLTAANLTGFALVAVLLLQGAGYWEAKLRQLREGAPALPGWRFFSAARAADVPILVGGIGFTAYAVAIDPGAGSLPGLGFGLFAALEYVNYFHVQLMYDNAADLRRLLRGGPRRSHLARDLDNRSARRHDMASGAA